MEVRYVYFRLKDAIGSPFTAEMSPHAMLTRKLRMQMLEQQEIIRQSDIEILCKSTLLGNSGLDISKVQDYINPLISKSFSMRFPYVRITEEHKKSDTEDRYAKYFKYLDELEQEKAKSQESAPADIH